MARLKAELSGTCPGPTTAFGQWWKDFLIAYFMMCYIHFPCTERRMPVFACVFKSTCRWSANGSTGVHPSVGNENMSQHDCLTRGHPVQTWKSTGTLCICFVENQLKPNLVKSTCFKRTISSADNSQPLNPQRLWLLYRDTSVLAHFYVFLCPCLQSIYN